MSRFTNNESVVRRVLALALSLAIQAAGISVPLVHAHPDEHATSHHVGRAVHAHWGGHGHTHAPADGPALEETQHDRAVSVNAFVAVGVRPFPAPVVIPVAVALPAPVERAAHETVEISPGHDPPFYRSLPARAPPAHLS
jgi:hypothetical protein